MTAIKIESINCICGYEAPPDSYCVDKNEMICPICNTVVLRVTENYNG